MDQNKINLIVVTGPTATGKTTFAAHLAARVDGEIISADSRQVYRGMDLATGKDKLDYVVNNREIPVHLVDILDPGYEYNVYEFQRDFLEVFKDITARGKYPLLCGGTGLYIESVLKGYQLVQVPENKALRADLEGKSMEALIAVLKSFKIPHNVTDTSNRKRLIRAIEIQDYYIKHPIPDRSFPSIKPVVFGIRFERDQIRTRITERLKDRLDQGMLDEINELLQKGLSPGQLKFYGLEYRYLTQHVIGEITYEEMVRLLNTAIHQFAKRQMTWFRKMERGGITIHWIDGVLPMDKKIERAMHLLHKMAKN
jgi:tRNA dimethylallyltransferase